MVTDLIFKQINDIKSMREKLIKDASAQRHREVQYLTATLQAISTLQAIKKETETEIKKQTET